MPTNWWAYTPGLGYMIEVTAHQRTLKEARHEMQVAREFTHERTKQRIAHLNALAMAPAARAQPATPQRSPRGWGMTRQADRFFVQQQLREMNFDEPAFAQRPTLLGAPNQRVQNVNMFDSAQEDVEEEGGATSALDAKPDASTGEETEASGRSPQAPSAERRCRRNRAMCKGSVLGHVKNFEGLRISVLGFPLFRWDY